MKFLVTFDLISTKSNFNYLCNLYSFKSTIIWFLIIVNIGRNEAKVLSQNKYCADIECKEPIAIGKTVAMYQKSDDMMISFPKDLKVNIFAKTDDQKHYDIEVKGKRGFAPTAHILEEKILHKNPEKLVNINTKPEEVDSETKVINESTNTDQNQDLKVVDNSSAQDLQTSNEPQIVSSLTEDSVESQTITPTRDGFTVVDGTTFMDEDIAYESSPTIRTEPATATKTATITLNLDNITEVKPNDTYSILNTNETLNIDIETIETPNNERTDPIVNSEEIKSKDESNDIKESNNDFVANDLDLKPNDENKDNVVLENEIKSNLTENVINNEISNNTIADQNVNHIKEEQINETISEIEDPIEGISESKIPELNSNIESIPETNDTLIGLEAMAVTDVINDINPDDIEVKGKQGFDPKAHILEEKVLHKNPKELVDIITKPEGVHSETKVLNESTSSDQNQDLKDVDKSSAQDLQTPNEPQIVSSLTEGSVESQTIIPTRDNFTAVEETDPIDNSEEIKSDVESFESNDIKESNNDFVANDLDLKSNDENKEYVVSEKEENETKYSLNENVINNEISNNTIADQDVDYIKEEQINETISEIEDPIEGISESKISELNSNIENIESISETKDTFKWMGLEGMAVTDVISDIIPDDIELILKQFQISAQVVVFTFIIAFNWCLMKIFLSVFNSSQKESELRKIGCSAQRQAYYFAAEKEKLQKEIDREREKAQMAEERMQSAEHRVIPLEREFSKLKSERDQLYQKVISLESELESAAEAGFEASRLLSDFLTSQKENVNLNSSVDALQQQITKQSEIVSKYEKTAQQKEKENLAFKEKLEKMNAELDRLRNVLKETEHNLEIVQKNNEELKESKSNLNYNLSQLEEEFSSLQNKTEDYIQRNDELLNDVQRFTLEIRELKEVSINKDLEIESLKEILVNITKTTNNCEELDEIEDKIDGEDNEKSLSNLYDIVKMELKLKNITNDRNDLNLKLEEVTQQCKELNNKLIALEIDNKELKSEKESAFQDRMKAQMELEVLTKYYKEKELELGKEIGVQHIQRQQKEEDVNSMSSRMIAFEEENISLRSQLQSMRKEIGDTERKYKNQINQLEKQIHENWILARNAERKLEESKAEAAVLRQTLTMSVKSPVDGFGGDISYLDDSSSSISSLHEQFGSTFPPPPPPPPMPPLPPPPMFNPLMPGMHMPYSEESDPSVLWNQNMNPMSIGSHLPQMANNFAPIQTDSMANHPNVSFPSMNVNSQPMSFVPSIQQQWESSSNRDTYSPSSHRSNSSPHSQYNMNMYSQPHSHYSNPMSSPLANSMSNHYNNSMTSVSSPLVNSSPSVQSVSVLSDPVPSHWMRPNGNISNDNYRHNEDYNHNESEGSSRSTSRNDTNPLHTSIV